MQNIYLYAAASIFSQNYQCAVAHKERPPLLNILLWFTSSLQMFYWKDVRYIMKYIIPLQVLRIYIASACMKVTNNLNKETNVSNVHTESFIYIRQGNRRLSLAALTGLPAASRGIKLPLLANTRSVF